MLDISLLVFGLNVCSVSTNITVFQPLLRLNEF